MHTGMRIGEVCGLRWCDVDFETGLISIRHSVA
ncbi:MAG: tyrosine-type recombinase/integrase, partial [Collinsella sp.]